MASSCLFNHMKYILALVFMFGFVRELFTIGHIASNKQSTTKRQALLLPAGAAVLMVVSSLIIATQNIV